MFEAEESGYSTKIVLLTDDGYTGPEISMVTNYYDHKIRKWIHRYTEKVLMEYHSKSININQ